MKFTIRAALGRECARNPTPRKPFARWHGRCTAHGTVPRDRPVRSPRFPSPTDATHAMSSVPERRRHPRISVSWPVRLWVDDEALLGRAEDASRYGLWVIVPPTTALKLGRPAGSTS